MKKIFILIGIMCFTLLSHAQWNMDPAVNLEVAGLPVSDMQSLTTSDGKTWVAFYHENAGNYDMRAQLLDKDGYKLLGPDGVLVSNQPSGTATFVFNICKDEANNLIIAFQDQRAGGLVAVVYKISPSGALLWGNNGIVLGEGLAPYPGVLNNNDLVVCWNESTTNTLNLQKINSAGSIVWSSPVQVRVGTSSTTRGQVVPNLNGNFTLLFQRRSFGINSTLYAQRFNVNGIAQWTAPVLLNTEATSAARYYSVQSDQDTTYCGFYTSPGFRFNSWLQRINPDGTLPYGSNGSAFSMAVSSSDPYQQTTRIALMPGSPYVWSVSSFSDPSQGQYGVYVQKFLKSNGSRLLGDNAKMVYPVSAAFETQQGELSLLNDGPFFMSADVNNKLYATRLDSVGNFVWTGNRVAMATTSQSKGRYGFTGLSNTQAVAVWSENRGVNLAYAQNISPGGLFGLKVATQGGVPAVINTSSGTLQITSVIYPSTANQAVIWSIVPVSGSAGITAGGLVTAVADGLVWAKAVSVQDSTVTDSLQISITNNSTIPVTGIQVSTLGGVPAVISGLSTTLQLVAAISPANATDQRIAWSIVAGTGDATIDANGLVTAVSNGTVWGKAVSLANPLLKDSLQITINNTIPVIQLTVNTQGGVLPEIVTVGGTLQMVAIITPANATDQRVTWSIVSGTGAATIDQNGLVTAVSNGTVWARAVSVAYPLLQDSMQITIGTNQPSLQNFSVYPNPSSGILNVRSSTPHGSFSLLVYDACGRKLRAFTVPANALQLPFTIDLSFLPSGLYYLYGVGNMEVKRIKWVKF